MDLDEAGAPADIAALIHKHLPELAPDFPIEDLCRALDIPSITLTDTAAYEAALVTDVNKAEGAILLARSSSPRRRRFSIGHELGHFLIPTHKVRPGKGFSCSCDDLRFADTGDRDRHRRMEAEANRFAAHLLMPPSRIRARADTLRPSLADIIKLAADYKVSKEAMARSYTRTAFCDDDKPSLFIGTVRVPAATIFVAIIKAVIFAHTRADLDEMRSHSIPLEW